MATPTRRFGRLIPAAGISLAAAAALALPVPTSPEACPPIDLPAPTTLSAPLGATRSAPVVPGSAGIRVFVDPDTGRIRRSTPEQRQRLAPTAARDRSGRTYEVRTRADGARIVRLDETFMMSVEARMAPDGSVSYRCRTGSAPLEAASGVGSGGKEPGR